MKVQPVAWLHRVGSVAKPNGIRRASVSNQHGGEPLVLESDYLALTAKYEAERAAREAAFREGWEYGYGRGQETPNAYSQPRKLEADWREYTAELAAMKGSQP